MSEKSELDIIWQEHDGRVNAFINDEIVGSVVLPNRNRDYFFVSGCYQLNVRDKFHRHETLDGAKQAIINVYLDLEEKPDDLIVTGQMKAWRDGEWLLSSEEYQAAKTGLKDTCMSRMGGAVSHGADIAGRTEAAVYLTSSNMTSNGYVMRLDIIADEVAKVAISEAPSGLHIS